MGDSKKARQWLSRWTVAGGLTLLLCVIILSIADADSLEGYEGSILAVDLGVTVFAINFSFISYQLSPYRYFYRGISTNQLVGSTVLLGLGTSSYATLLVRSAEAPVLGLALLPVLLFGSVALQAIARHETSGETVLARLSSHRALVRFESEFTAKFMHDRETRPVGKPQDVPTHEWSWQLPPETIEADPFTRVAALSAVALKNDDLGTFEASIVTCLRRRDDIEALPLRPDDKSGSRERLIDHAGKAIHRIWLSTCEEDKGGAFMQGLQTRLIRYVSQRLDRLREKSDQCFFALSLVSRIATECPTTFRPQLSLAAIVAARQVAQKGIDELAHEQEASDQRTIFRHELPYAATLIKRIGSQLIRDKNTDSLYRVLDAMGWLGCSAVRNDNHEVGRACLRALAQLGRESRAEQLECYWDKCAMEPWQHASERIEWMLSWVSKLPAESQPRWTGTIGEAVSRLYGRKAEVTKKSTEEQETFVATLSTDAYTIRHLGPGGSRTIDYSDLSFLKDLELY